MNLKNNTENTINKNIIITESELIVVFNACKRMFKKRELKSRGYSQDF